MRWPKNCKRSRVPVVVGRAAAVVVVAARV